MQKTKRITVKISTLPSDKNLSIKFQDYLKLE